MMMMMGDQEEEEEVEEKWLTHYSSNHQILLVGEGDFSFSLSLATSFSSASNICASSLDSQETLIKKYRKARSNLEDLAKLGASLLHEVDATKMKYHPDLCRRKFDRIIFNFPHAGFHGKEDNTDLIEMHRALVRDFFENARHLLRANGQIHVNHKVKKPFCDWKIEQLATCSSLSLIQIVSFRKEDYPGYNNKRGHGPRSDEPFHLGKCHTLKFKFAPVAKKLSPTITGAAGERQCQLQQSWVQMQHQQPWPTTFYNLTYHEPQRSSVTDARTHISPSAASSFNDIMRNGSTSRIRGAIPQQSKAYPMQRNLTLASESPYAWQRQIHLNLGLPSILHGEFGSLNRRHGQPELTERTYSNVISPSLEKRMTDTSHVMQRVGLASILDRKECSFSIQGKDLHPHHVRSPNDVEESVFRRRNPGEGMWHHHDEMPQTFVNDSSHLQERHRYHRSVLRL